MVECLFCEDVAPLARMCLIAHFGGLIYLICPNCCVRYSSIRATMSPNRHWPASTCLVEPTFANRRMVDP